MPRLDALHEEKPNRHGHHVAGRRPVLLVLLVLAVAGCSDDDVAPADMSTMCSSAAECDDGVFCNGSESCNPLSPMANTLGCVPGGDPCGGEGCDETTRECEVGCADSDGDGEGSVDCGGTDCDDTNPDVNSAATEVCDLEGVDEDCDPLTVGERDLDDDGYVDARCCNGANCGEDCDETRRGTNPVVPEVCDGRDNDCDGAVDEELLQSVFVDADRDLHGDPEMTTMACPGRVGTSASSLDCDDAEPYANTPQVEITDGVDNDCDGTTDEDPQAVTWYPDTDGDGFGDPDGVTVDASTVQTGYSLLPYDCDDSDADVSPLATETCNGIDDDCDGEANFVIGINDWEDDDGDGVPDAACAGAGGDCDDTDPATHPGGREICDLRDNDCNGSVDDDCSLPFPSALVGRWRRCGDGSTAVEACAGDSGYDIVLFADGTVVNAQDDGSCTRTAFEADGTVLSLFDCVGGTARQLDFTWTVEGPYLDLLGEEEGETFSLYFERVSADTDTSDCIGIVDETDCLP